MRVAKIKSTAGYTLIEVIASLGIMAILGLASAHLYTSFLASSQQQQLVLTRDQVVLWVRQSAGSLAGLRNSLKQPENVDFYNCVCGQGAGCSSAQSYKMTLYDIDSNVPKPITTYYSVGGTPCNQSDPNCLIQVDVGFVAQCSSVLPSADPTPPATCVGQPVEFFGVTYKVQQNPATVAAKGNLFKMVGGSAFTSVTALRNSAMGVCP